MKLTITVLLMGAFTGLAPWAGYAVTGSIGGAVVTGGFALGGLAAGVMAGISAAEDS